MELIWNNMAFVIPLGTFIFACIATALLRFDEWQERNGKGIYRMDTGTEPSSPTLTS